MHCTIVTLNLANYDDDAHWLRRRAIIARELQRIDAEVVLLQEVRFDFNKPSTQATGLDMASQLAVDLQMQCSIEIAQYYDPVSRIPVDRVTSLWEGLAILSRRSPRVRGALTLITDTEGDGNQRITQHCVYGALGLYNVHFSTTEQEMGDNLWETLLLMSKSETPLRLCGGDMNATPELVTPLLTSEGLVDAWQLMHPTTEGFTFPSDAPSKRIDYLWIDQRLVPALKNVFLLFKKPIDELYASDHCGVAATFEF